MNVATGTVTDVVDDKKSTNNNSSPTNDKESTVSALKHSRKDSTDVTNSIESMDIDVDSGETSPHANKFVAPKQFPEQKNGDKPDGDKLSDKKNGSNNGKLKRE